MRCDNSCRDSPGGRRLADGGVARRRCTRVAIAWSVWLALLSLSASSAHAQAAEATAAWQCSDGMEALLLRFARVRGARARFEEQKHIALLAVPLSSRGTVHFAAPDTLLRVQTAPAPAAMLLEGKRVRFGDEAGVRSMSLSQWEAAEGLIGGYLEVLRGDASGLRKHYHTKFSCEGGQWTLQLSPRSAALEKLLRSMTLRGDGTRLTHSELVDAHGDRTVTRFSEHAGDAERVENPGDLARRFGALQPAASSKPSAGTTTKR